MTEPRSRRVRPLQRSLFTGPLVLTDPRYMVQPEGAPEPGGQPYGIYDTFVQDFVKGWSGNASYMEVAKRVSYMNEDYERTLR